MIIIQSAMSSANHRLDKNENNFALPLSLSKLSSQKIYPDSYDQSLYQTISQFHEINPESIYLDNGLENCLIRLFASVKLSRMATSIILQDLSWDHYLSIIESCHYIPKQIKTFKTICDRHHYLADYDSLSKLLETNKKRQFVIITNPNNPTGHSHKSQVILKLVKKHPEHLFFIDLAYIGFDNNSFKINPFITQSQKLNNLILGYSYSKFFSCPGIRFGYLISNPKLLDQLKIKPLYLGINHNTSTGVVSLIDHYDFFKKQTDKICSLRLQYINKLNQLPKIVALNSSANFILIKLPKEIDCQRLDKYLKKNHFYLKIIQKTVLDSPHMRITICRQKIFDQLLSLLQKFIEKN